MSGLIPADSHCPMGAARVAVPQDPKTPVRPTRPVPTAHLAGKAALQDHLLSLHQQGFTYEELSSVLEELHDQLEVARTSNLPPAPRPEIEEIVPEPTQPAEEREIRGTRRFWGS